MSLSAFPSHLPPRPAAALGAYRHAGEEPRLQEVYDDAIVRAVMRRDGVSDAMLRRVVACTRERLGLGAAPARILVPVEARR